jgi:hypothetical protein
MTAFATGRSSCWLAHNQIAQIAHSDFLSGLRATLTWAVR